MRILVADKDPYDLAALKSVLSSPGTEVLEATDGAEAMRIAVEKTPRVVVAASSLGQMGGLAMARELKMLSGRGDIPEVAVIVLLERAADAWLADWSLCDAHRVKPVDAGDLESLVRELVTRPPERTAV